MPTLKAETTNRYTKQELINIVRTTGHPDSRTNKQIIDSINSFYPLKSSYSTYRSQETDIEKLRTKEPHDYPGGFPEGYKKKIIDKHVTSKIGNVNKEDILQPFGGGSSESKQIGGDTIDINPNTKPTVVGDSTTEEPYKKLLEKRRGKKYKLIIIDPPWGSKQAKDYYGTKPISRDESRKLLRIASKYLEPEGRVVVRDTRTYLTPISLRKEKTILEESRWAKGEGGLYTQNQIYRKTQPWERRQLIKKFKHQQKWKSKHHKK